MDIFADPLSRDALGALYAATVGYDPFEDDPAITAREVRQTLDSYFALSEVQEMMESPRGTYWDKPDA